MLENVKEIEKKELISLKDRICLSNEFKTKRKLCKLLNYIINKSFDGHEGDFKGYSIGTEVFNRPEDFNPDDDPIVRIHVGRLRRSLELYYLKDGSDDEIIITIPKGANVPVFKFSHLTDVKKDIETHVDNISNRIEQTTIAVVPFLNLTGDAEKEYLATGFTEDFIIELTKYEDFKILVFAKGYQPLQHSPSSNNSDSDAHYLIEGSVRVNDNLIKINVKLIDTQKHENVWGENFEHNMDSIGLVELQESICKRVVKVLAGEYGVIIQSLSEESYRKNISEVETYDAILRFYHYEYTLSPDAAKRAIVSLENAIKNDPNCGVVYSMLASIYGTGFLLDQPGSELLFKKMINYAKKGIELTPNNQTCQIVYAWNYFAQNKIELFLKHLENVLEMNLKSPLRIGYVGFFLSLVGEWENGIILLRNAMELNSGFPKTFYGVTTLYFYRQDQFEKAYNEASKYDMPELFWAPLLRAACLGKLNRISEAKEQLEQLFQLRPDFKEKAKYLLGMYIKEDDLLEDVLRGLEMSGIDFNNRSEI